MLELEKIKEELDDLRNKMVNLILQVNQIEEEQKEDLTKLCTIDEKIILKNLDYVSTKKIIVPEKIEWWIARDRRGLYIYGDEPTFSTEGNEFYDEDNCYYDFNMFSHSFKFINTDACYRVSDLIADLEEEIEL